MANKKLFILKVISEDDSSIFNFSTSKRMIEALTASTIRTCEPWKLNKIIFALDCGTDDNPYSVQMCTAEYNRALLVSRLKTDNLVWASGVDGNNKHIEIELTWEYLDAEELH